MTTLRQVMASRATLDSKVASRFALDEQQRASNGQFGSGGGGSSAGGKKEAKRIASLPPKSDPGYNAAVAKSLGVKPESEKSKKTKEELRIASLPPKSDPGYNAAVAKSLGL